MTSYHDDNLPGEMMIDAVPDELFNDALAALAQAVESGQVLAKEALAAHVYDRKGYMSFDSFVKENKASHTNNTRDDVIIQLTVRIHNPRMFDGGDLNLTTELEEHVAEYTVNAKRERLEAAIGQAEDEARKADATAREKRRLLDALRKELPSK